MIRDRINSPSLFASDLDARPGTLFGDIRHEMNMYARSAFAGNFASGGLSAQLFSNTFAGRMRAWGSAWNPLTMFSGVPEGSPEWKANMTAIEKSAPKSMRAKIRLERIKGGSAAKTVLKSAGMKAGMGVAGVGLSAGFAAYSAYSTEGGAFQKGNAAVSSIAGDIAFGAGALVFSGIGAAVGGPVGLAIGIIGSVATAMGATEGTAMFGNYINNKVLEREQRRKLEWVNSNAAFNTQKAYTMRQQSLAMMNRGEMSARSLMGREAVMMHQ